MGKSVIIVGGGASGLTAAISAARAGAQVTVLDGMERCGKKLLATGNGRCNLTNLDPALPTKYYGTGSELAEHVTSRRDADWTLAFFEELGLLAQERDGYVYPYAAQASSVLETLLAELRRLRVKLKFKEKIRSVEKKDDKWHVKTDTWCYTACALVLACGSKAAPDTGSDGSGYALAKTLGHTIITPRPALVPVVCEGLLPAQLAGVRCRASVSLYERLDNRAELLAKDSGELQWTKYGVSGIVIFQLSRFISGCKALETLYLQIDLLPDFNETYLTDLLEKRVQLIDMERVSALLSGMLHEKLISAVLQAAGILAKTVCRDLTKEQIRNVIQTAKKFQLNVAGTKSFDACQICTGGVHCREVSMDSLESLKHKNLFFAGELLDVDGPCGGYNLQWAWASGYLAGESAAEAAIRQ